MQKVLIITYYWPPAGGPGVQRWLKFVKYLSDFDIDPLVYVPENPNYPIVDESLLKEVPANVQILKRSIFEPYRFAALLSKKKTQRISSGIIQKYKKQSALERLLLWIRGNFFIPDARKFWVRPSVNFLSDVIQKENIKTIITTGPPHSIHLIGLQLKKKFDLQWIADFRDPWTSIGYHHKLKLTKTSQQKHKKLESVVLNVADKLVVTSETTKKEFEALTSKPIKVITNGYDEAASDEKLDAAFTLSHIGSLLTERNPEVLWKTLRAILDENDDFKKYLKIQLVGVVGEGVMQSLEAFELQSYVDVLGYVSHDGVLKLQRKSQVLLLLEIDTHETKGIIPGKLFEYLNARRPILAIGPKGWEAAQMVSTTKAGAGLHPKQELELKNVLLDWFESYQKGTLNIHSEGIEKYSRRELTAELARYIKWESS